MLKLGKTIATAAMLAALQAPVFAGTTGLAWEAPLTRLRTSGTGIVAVAVGSLAIMGVTIGAALMRETLQEVMGKFANLALLLGAGLGASGLIVTWFAAVGAVV